MVHWKVGECVVLCHGQLVLQVRDSLEDYHFIGTLQLLEDQFVVLEQRRPALVVLAERRQEPLLSRPNILLEANLL